MSPLSDYWKELPSRNSQSSDLRLDCPHHVAQIGFASLYFHLISIHWTWEGTKAENISWRFHDARGSRRGVMRGRVRVHITRWQGPAAVARRLLWSLLIMFPSLCPDLWVVIVLKGAAVCCYCGGKRWGAWVVLIWEGRWSRRMQPCQDIPQIQRVRKASWLSATFKSTRTTKNQTSWRKRPVVLETIWNPE